MLIKALPFTASRTPCKSIKRFRRKKRPLWVKPKSHPLRRSWSIWMTDRPLPIKPTVSQPVSGERLIKDANLSTNDTQRLNAWAWMLLAKGTGCRRPLYPSVSNTSAKHRRTTI